METERPDMSRFWVQVFVHHLGQGLADAVDLGDVLEAGFVQALDATEVFEQLVAAFGADAGDVIQGGLMPGFFEGFAVTFDGEAVGFVADELDHQGQQAVAFGFDELALVGLVVGQVYAFFARGAVIVFGDADDLDVGDTLFLEDVQGLVDLAFAAINHKHIRMRSFAFAPNWPNAFQSPGAWRRNHRRP